MYDGERDFEVMRLAERAQRKTVNRRTFLIQASVLGLSMTSAAALFAACTSGGNGGGGGTATPEPGQEGELIRRLPELTELPVDMQKAYPTVTAGKKMIYIGIFGAHPQIKFYDDLFKSEATRLGMDYSFLDSAFDAAKELANLDQALSRKFDVIILHPVDPAGASPQVKRAREQGTIVVNIQTDTVVRPTIKHGWNWYENGVITAEWLGDKLGGQGKVVGVVGELGTTAGKGRKAGFLDTMEAKFPDIEVLDFLDGAGWNQEGGYEYGQTILQTHAQLDAIAALEDQQGIGMRKAAVDAGRSEGLIITGCDGQKEGQEAVGDGRLDMSVMMQRGFGPEALGAVDMVEALIRGEVHGDAIQAGHFPPQLPVTADTIADQWQSPI